MSETVEKIGEKIEGINTQIKTANEEIEALKNQLKESVTKEDKDNIVSKIDDVNEKLNGLIESGKDTDKNEPEIIKSLKKNAKPVADGGNDYQVSSFSRKEVLKAPALMTTANVLPNVTGGFTPLLGSYIDAEIGKIPKPDPVFMKLVSVKYQPGIDVIYYVDRINEEGNAQFIGEGDLKPLIDAEYKAEKEPIKEIAERWKFTTRLVYHAPAVINDFAEHAKELVDVKIDDQIAIGDGVGNNLKGIDLLSSAFIVPTQLANFYQSANIYDVIMAMAIRVRLNNFKGKLTCVLNTVWMAKMMGVKDTQNRYIIPDFASPDGKMVGEVEVVFSNNISDAKIIVGDLSKYNLVVAEELIFGEGFENDDFSRNLISKKLESFLGSYVKKSDLGAIIMDDIATVLTTINKL